MSPFLVTDSQKAVKMLLWENSEGHPQPVHLSFSLWEWRVLPGEEEVQCPCVCQHVGGERHLQTCGLASAAWGWTGSRAPHLWVSACSVVSESPSHMCLEPPKLPHIFFFSLSKITVVAFWCCFMLYGAVYLNESSFILTWFADIHWRIKKDWDCLRKILKPSSCLREGDWILWICSLSWDGLALMEVGMADGSQLILWITRNFLILVCIVLWGN